MPDGQHSAHSSQDIDGEQTSHWGMGGWGLLAFPSPPRWALPLPRAPAKTESFTRRPSAIWTGHRARGSGPEPRERTRTLCASTHTWLLLCWLGRSWGVGSCWPSGPQTGQLLPVPTSTQRGLESGHSPGGLHMRIWLWPCSREAGGTAANFSQEVVLGARSGAGEAEEHWAWQRSWVSEGGMPW